VSRITLEDGRHFDPETAATYDEDSYFDGHNHVSRATGEEFRHERLYRTPGGRWILERSSQWQGETAGYREVSAALAASWLVRNGHEPPAELAAAIASLDVDAPQPVGVFACGRDDVDESGGVRDDW